MNNDDAHTHVHAHIIWHGYERLREVEELQENDRNASSQPEPKTDFYVNFETTTTSSSSAHHRHRLLRLGTRTHTHTYTWSQPTERCIHTHTVLGRIGCTWRDTMTECTCTWRFRGTVLLVRWTLLAHKRKSLVLYGVGQPSIVIQSVYKRTQTHTHKHWVDTMASSNRRGSWTLYTISRHIKKASDSRAACFQLVWIVLLVHV